MNCRNSRVGWNLPRVEDEIPHLAVEDIGRVRAVLLVAFDEPYAATSAIDPKCWGCENRRHAVRIANYLSKIEIIDGTAYKVGACG